MAVAQGGRVNGNGPEMSGCDLQPCWSGARNPPGPLLWPLWEKLPYQLHRQGLEGGIPESEAGSGRGGERGPFPLLLLAGKS